MSSTRQQQQQQQQRFQSTSTHSSHEQQDNNNNNNNNNNKSNNNNNDNSSSKKKSGGGSRLLKGTALVTIGAISYLIVDQMIHGDGFDDLANVDAESQLKYKELINKQVQSADLPHEKVMIDHANVNRKPRLVIIGTGWGATSLLQSIDHTKYDVIVVSPRNYFLFTPMLPSTTTGAVDYRSIVDPVRSMIYRKTGIKSASHPDTIRYFEATCHSVDHVNNVISCDKKGSEGKLSIEYDKLVISVGATVNTFGTKGVEQHCHYLKEVDDARNIRKSLMEALEKASYPET